MGFKEVVISLVCIVWSGRALSQHIDFSSINSPYDEQNPVLSADRKTLFVTRSNHPQNMGGLKDPGDIWMSTLSTSGWGVLTHGGAVLNDKAYNTVVGSSADGKRILVAHHPSKNGEPAKTQGLSSSTFENGVWSMLQPIQIPYFHSRSGNIQGQLSPDGNHLVYAAETYGTQGVEDIYVVHKQNDSWSEPLHLGLSINTGFQELSPSLNASNDTLYFSSNGRKGVGSFDVYASARLDDTWINWSDPVNMKNINTEGRELYYKSLGNGNALYTTTRNSDGYGDVRFYDAGTPLKVDSLVSEIPVAIRSNSLLISGKVIDAHTQLPIEAIITLKINTGETQIKSTTSGYTAAVIKENYQLIIEAKGYVSSFQRFNLSVITSSQTEFDFSLQPIEKGATVNLKNVLFKQSSTDLLENSVDELKVVVSFLKANPSVRIALTGHTDNRGVHADNVKLSEARVQKVKDYLIKSGIASKRVKGKGIGGLQPIANNDTDEGRRLNRRVEFTIVKK